MSESSTPFEGENFASYEALKTAIGLSDGFSLIFAVTNTEAGAQEVMRRLWREGVRYQKAWLRDPERPLVDQVVESVRSAKLPIMVLGLEGLTTMRETMSRSLQNLNWTRPQWTTRFAQTIVFWVTTDMEPLLAREAPDLWRFRSLRVEFTFGFLPRAARATEINRRLRTLDLSPRVRVSLLVQLFGLTRNQNVLMEAVRVVVGNQGLPWSDEFEQLHSLFFASSDIDDRALERIKRLPKLRNLTFMYSKNSDQGLASALARMNPDELTDANFYGATVGKATFAELSRLPRLTDLIIATTNLSDEDIESLSTIQSLRHLELPGKSLSNKGLEFICGMPQVSTLGVDDSMVSDEGAKHLPQLSHLWMLGLANTQVTSRSLSSIVQLRDLRDLDLGGTKVTDSKLNLLANLTRIQRIDLKGAKVTKKGAAKLREAFAAQRRKVEVIV